MGEVAQLGGIPVIDFTMGFLARNEGFDAEEGNPHPVNFDLLGRADGICISVVAKVRAGTAVMSSASVSLAP